MQWAPSSLNDLEVPGGVIRGFVGVGQSISRIHDDAARLLTPQLWQRLHGQPQEPLGMSPGDVIEKLLDPYDVEDLIDVWLQVAGGYVALPRSRQRDTPAHEFPMFDRTTGRRGIVQVKTGNVPVDLEQLRRAAGDHTDVFAYATSNRYEGDRDGVRIIRTADLVEFIEQHPLVIPPRVTTWLDAS